MPKYTIDILIRLLSPVNISEPGGYRYNFTTDRWTYDTNGTWPGKRTKAFQVAVPASEMASGDGASGVKRLPILPGNSLRGALRRCAGNLVMDAIIARGETFSFDLYHILMCGAASSKPDGSTTVSFATQAAKNPMAALFGGGPQMVWSRSSTGIAFPINALTIALGFVPASLAIHSVGNNDLTATVMDPRVDDILRGNSSVQLGGIADLDNAIMKWVRFTAEGSKAREGAKKKAKGTQSAETASAAEQRGLQSLSATEYLLPGLTFHSRDILDTDLPGPAMLGLYILARAASANTNRLGGMWRNGFGRYTITATARRPGGSTFELLSVTNETYAPNLAEDEVRNAVEAWQDWARSVCSAAVMEAAFSVPQETETAAPAEVSGS